VRNALNRRNDSGAKAGLNLPTIQNFQIAIPDIKAQQRIVSILDTWTNFVEALSKEITYKQTLKDALAQELLSGKRRLTGESSEWKDISLDELVKNGSITLGRGNVISKKDMEMFPGEYPIYSSSVKNDGLFGRYGKYMFDEELISWSVDGGGHFFYRPKSRFSVTNVSGWMRINDKDICCQFLALQLQTLHKRMLFDYQFKAHPSVIRGLYTLSLPPIEEQESIAKIISVANHEIELLKQKRAIIENQYKYLLANLATGTMNSEINNYREEPQYA